MSLFSKLKQFLPVSSRSFHAMYREMGVMHAEVHDMHEELDDINQKLDVLTKQATELYGRIEVADRGINSNINYKFETRTIPLIESLRSDLDAHDTHVKMLEWENYRHEGETTQEAKRRFFRSLPQATGGLRLLQLGCAKLLQEFDSLCEENHIPYWINFGTLLGAVRNGGFIPWDDDTDLGIMREDLDRLMEVVAQDSRYRITVVYDRFVHCRQVRFRYVEEDVPCFLDLFIYDWAPDARAEKAERLRALRQEMVSRMDADPELVFWKDAPYYSSSERGAQKIQSYYDDCLRQAREEGLICSKEQAAAVVWSPDNLDDGKQRQWAYSLGDLFPTQQLSFEDARLQAPKNPDKFLWSRYGDYYELPGDIHSHFAHVDHAELDNPEVVDALKKKL